MKNKTITYFNTSGEENTQEVINIVKKQLHELKHENSANLIKHVVVATSSGKTALMLADEIDNIEVEIIAVTLHSGFRGGDIVTISEETKAIFKEKNIKLLISSHALSGVGRSISDKFGGTTPVEIIANTLRMFSGHGLKVAAEISVMAADAGLIPTNRNIIAIGGTKKGADTAVILKPAHMNNFFEMDFKEILAKPI